MIEFPRNEMVYTTPGPSQYMVGPGVVAATGSTPM